MISKFDTLSVDWIALAPGAWYKPVRFNASGKGWASLVRLAPGTTVSRHRHVGSTQGYALQGRGRFIEEDVEVSVGTFVCEPAGTVDSLVAEGSEDLIMLFIVDEAIEYLNDDDTIARQETQETKISGFLDHREAQSPDETALRF